MVTKFIYSQFSRDISVSVMRSENRLVICHRDLSSCKIKKEATGQNIEGVATALVVIAAPLEARA